MEDAAGRVPTGEPEAHTGAIELKSESPPELFCRIRRDKILGPLPGRPADEGRTIEIDIIVASPAAWAASAERLESGWDPVRIDGLILAERTIG